MNLLTTQDPAVDDARARDAILAMLGRPRAERRTRDLPGGLLIEHGDERVRVTSAQVLDAVEEWRAGRPVRESHVVRLNAA